MQICRAASTEPPEEPSSPRLPTELLDRYRKPDVKPELDDYICLNFVSKEGTAPETSRAIEQRPSSRGLDDSRALNDEHDEIGGHGGGAGEANYAERDDRIWRSSAIRSRDNQTENSRHDNRQDTLSENARSRGAGGSTESDTGSDERNNNEARLYPRTLGSSVSVLDEKDAVARATGARFAGEDPVRGRLRVSDPFQWIGRLHAGAAGIDDLLGQADSSLQGLFGSTSSNTIGCGSVSGSSGDVRLTALGYQKHQMWTLLCRDFVRGRFAEAVAALTSLAI